MLAQNVKNQISVPILDLVLIRNFTQSQIWYRTQKVGTADLCCVIAITLRFRLLDPTHGEFHQMILRALWRHHTVEFGSVGN